MDDYLFFGYKLRTETAQPPRRATAWSSGWDLCADEEAIVWPLSSATISTGVQFFMHQGHWFHCVNRSSYFQKRGLVVNTSPIDADYRWQMNRDGVPACDEYGRPVPLIWHIIVRNISLIPRRIHIGDRLAQIVVPYVLATRVAFVDAMSLWPNAEVTFAHNWTSDRIEGLGSTGR